MKKHIAVLLSICLFIGLCFTATASDAKPLRFDADGTFTVLQLTDPQDDANLAKELVPFLEKAIQTAQPDLIVITGDLVENSRPGGLFKDDEALLEGVEVKNDYAASLANTQKAIAQMFAVLEESGIPYAVTQGNNDYSSSVTNEDWLKIYAQYPNCLTVDQSNDPDGKIDMYLEILASDSDAPAFGLWLMDNGKGMTDGQLDWMKSVETEQVPGIVFEHIPVDDIGNLFEKCSPWDSGAFFSDGLCTRLIADRAAGHVEYAHEPGISTEEFATWKECNVTGAFFGHEHTSGYTGTFDGITMGLTYGCQFEKAGPYGMRTLVLSEDGSFETSLYTYTDGSFTLQNDVPTVDGNEDGIKGFFNKIVNVFTFIMHSIAYMLKF